MTTPILIPVTLPADKQTPTNSIIHDIITPFLPREWPSVDPSTLAISPHSTSTNTCYTVQRPPPTAGRPLTEPLAVFIKLHNPATTSTPTDIDIFAHLVPSKQEEVALCAEFAQTGHGAKVHGFFRTLDGTAGRVDEFLDARTLEPEDVEDRTIRAETARAMAEFHALRAEQLVGKEVGLFYDALVGGLKKFCGMERLKVLGKEAGAGVDELVGHDFAEGVVRVVERLEGVGARTGWCVHDVQYLNVLVRNNPVEGESKVALVDFEFAMRNYRGFDIGGHFMQKMFKWFDEGSKIANCREYTKEEKRHFCDEYAERWNALTGDEDTGHQVFVEAEYGYLLAIAFDFHNMLCFMSDGGGKDPLDLLGLNKLFEVYIAQCASLGLDVS
ncbi:putative choline/ethanolamine kinase [Lasiosphaeris hirsuta]|uniref:Choline/ethanolamine kinase n=1 Tax=Lasiosphaeris hirsuta TaxID=260670 RepID=A0AA40DWL5_9PEZI|nr:putative choline/ethanolamine kinase [Lasiosphaeris hirsuta]